MVNECWCYVLRPKFLDWIVPLYLDKIEGLGLNIIINQLFSYLLLYGFCKLLLENKCLTILTVYIKGSSIMGLSWDVGEFMSDVLTVFL